MRKLLTLLLSAATLIGCSGSDNSSPNNDGRITIVTPTTAPGSASDDITKMQLKPGKLITLKQVNAANCKRAVVAGMCIDIMAQDATVFAGDMTDAKLDALFAEAGAAISSTSASLWGIHLPYQTYDVSTTDEPTRTTAVSKLKALIELSMKYLKPKHFVMHPSTGTILTTDAAFAGRLAQSRKSIRELQEYITSCNSTYNLNTILCVENCPRSLAFDAASTLELLNAAGLEQVRICLDTGHALIPLNGSYVNPTKNGDAVALLKAIGTRLGTLHIQQNPGAVGESGTLDKHLQPHGGGLIDWGEFYYELLKNNRYRGCFLYEVSFVDTYNGASATIETAKTNYANFIYPAYKQTLQRK
ncbi:TIM barrel protein [uncultured Alistipes sp.]|jgi:xylose isomerase-like TIM barrel|uniref:sugar phosphate isomerase/epimerase family protein n=1 Tax=uncultured Alistipes sp. TaxID=538949 RepID=UPI0025D6B3B0|nr:TIM barrel protein [uncultured Alistipes sp.]